MKYIKYPIRFNALLKGSDENQCEIHESIAYNIMLIITTSYGEVPDDKEYGSEIWELEFEQHIKKRDWEAKVRKSLYDSIAKYENRLNLISVDVALDEVEEQDLKRSVRRKANIIIKGTIKNNNLPFNFHTKLNISPVSQ